MAYWTVQKKKTMVNKPLYMGAKPVRKPQKKLISIAHKNNPLANLAAKKTGKKLKMPMAEGMRSTRMKSPNSGSTVTHSAVIPANAKQKPVHRNTTLRYLRVSRDTWCAGN